MSAYLTHRDPGDENDARKVLCSACMGCGFQNPQVGEVCGLCGGSGTERLGLVWDADSRIVQFDETMLFGHGYDFTGWDDLREEALAPDGSRYAIWPERVGGSWSAYGGPEGLLTSGLSSSAEARRVVASWCGLEAPVGRDHERIPPLVSKLCGLLDIEPKPPAPPVSEQAPWPRLTGDADAEAFVERVWRETGADLTKLEQDRADLEGLRP